MIIVIYLYQLILMYLDLPVSSEDWSRSLSGHVTKMPR